MVPPAPELQPTADAARERGRIFLSTEWRDLLMLNYEIDPVLLQPFVPRGTELDSFEGKTYVSLVGLRFARTKSSVPSPFPSIRISTKLISASTFAAAKAAKSAAA
jgi:uncharacterized protein YqjF (DUF2071 family)